MSNPAGSENEQPPIGKPIYDNQAPDSDRPDQLAPDQGSGEHVVITPQTAGSAGVANKEN